MIQALDAGQNMLVYLGAFVLVLTVVVFIHEFGHFQVARWCGIKVKSFSIGMGPELFGWVDRQGTRWKISALPIGGFVSWIDDTDVTSTQAASEADQALSQEEQRRRGYFRAAPLGARAATVAAGPIFNFIFAILAFAFLLMVLGRDVTDVNQLAPRVDHIVAGSAAEKAGLKPGDLILAIDDRMIDSFGALQERVGRSPGQELSLILERGGQRLTVPIIPDRKENLTATGATEVRGVLGIGRTTLPTERRIERLNPISAIGQGAVQTWTIVTSTVGYIGNIFSGKASPEHLAGPLGIIDMSGQVAKNAGQGDDFAEQARNLAAGLIGWAAMLSVALGFMNLLPVPLLDGGHLLFYAIEGVRGRPLDARAQNLSFRAGLAVLGSLFLFATWNDLQRLNVLEFLAGILS